MDGVRWNGYRKTEIIQPTNIDDGWLHKWWLKLQCVHHRQHLTFTFTHANTHKRKQFASTSDAWIIITVFGLILIWRYKQTHEITFVIVEIRTQMHSHLGSHSASGIALCARHKSVYFPFASVITQLKCTEIISNRVHFFVVSNAKSIRFAHYPNAKAITVCFSYFPTRIMCSAPFTARIKRRTKQIHTLTYK